MQTLSSAQLLDIWERGRTQSLAERALLLLAAACPETSAEALARLSVGRRNARLLALCELTFGSCLTGLANCPRCGERLEATFTAADIRTSPADESVESLALRVGDHEVQFRLPDSLDLMALARSSDTAAARRLLFERCLLDARSQHQAVSAHELPDEVVQAVAARMAQADPQADVRLALGCLSCGHRWLTAFEVVSFFWSEIDTWAVRLLHEVHTLASAYGWSEAEILALSSRRRQLYLEMVSG